MNDKVARARRCVARAEADRGPLRVWEKSDLLIDNGIADDGYEAKGLIDTLTARTTPDTATGETGEKMEGGTV